MREVGAAARPRAVPPRGSAPGARSGRDAGAGRERSLLLVISTLGAGGAERVLTTMAGWWARHGCRVTLLTLDDAASTSFYELDPAVRRDGLGLLGESRSPLGAVVANARRIVALRRRIRACGADAVISFGSETNVLVALASTGLPGAVVVSERCDPHFVPASRAWRLARRLGYRCADAVAVQTSRVAAFFAPHPCVEVIPNPLPPATAAAARRTGGPRRRRIVAMGRLVEQKGFDVLIEAFARIAGDVPQWDVVILGEGPLRGALERQAGDAGVGGRVTFAGLVADPLRWLGEAELFVLPSRFEGFPNALCEAMACGCAVIATDCPSGPADIVSDGVNGRLVPVEDSVALGDAIRDLAADDDGRRTLAAAARGVVDALTLDSVMARWDALLERLARAAAPAAAVPSPRQPGEDPGP